MQVFVAPVKTENRSIGTWAVKAANESASEEAVALSKLHTAHGGSAPCVVPLHGVVARPVVQVGDTMVTGTVSALLLQPMQGSLDAWLRQPGRQVTSLLLWTWISHLVTAVMAGEKAKVAHRDIKPDNILMDVDNNLYLADYGLSTCGVTATTTASTAHGTPWFMAPEVLRCLTPDNRPVPGATPFRVFAADVYSVGVSILQMAMPQLWLACEDLNLRTGASWSAMQARMLADVTQTCGVTLAHLVTRAMEPDPERRATAAELALITALGLEEARMHASAAANRRGVTLARAALHAHYLGATPPSPPPSAPLDSDARTWREDARLAEVVKLATQLLCSPGAAAHLQKLVAQAVRLLCLCARPACNEADRRCRFACMRVVM